MSKENSEREQGTYYPEGEFPECCEKCGDVYFEKIYPAHTPYLACLNLKCPCHSMSKEKESYEQRIESICGDYSEGQNKGYDGSDLDSWDLGIKNLNELVIQLLAKEREVERLRWMDLGTYETGYEAGRQSLRAELREKISDKIVDLDDPRNVVPRIRAEGTNAEYEVEGYNRGLNECLALLSPTDEVEKRCCEECFVEGGGYCDNAACLCHTKKV